MSGSGSLVSRGLTQPSLTCTCSPTSTTSSSWRQVWRRISTCFAAVGFSRITTSCCRLRNSQARSAWTSQRPATIRASSSYHALVVHQQQVPHLLGEEALHLRVVFRRCWQEGLSEPQVRCYGRRGAKAISTKLAPWFTVGPRLCAMVPGRLRLLVSGSLALANPVASVHGRSPSVR